MQEKFRPNYLLSNFKRSKESGILGAGSLLVLKILKMYSYPNYVFLKFRKEGVLHRVWMSEDFFNCVLLAVEKKFAKNLSKRAPHLKKQNSHPKLEIERALHFSCKTVRRALPQGLQAIFPFLELFGEMPPRPCGGPFLSNSTTCRLVFSGPRFRSLNAPWGGPIFDGSRFGQNGPKRHFPHFWVILVESWDPSLNGDLSVRGNFELKKLVTITFHLQFGAWSLVIGQKIVHNNFLFLTVVHLLLLFTWSCSSVAVEVAVHLI